MHFLHTMGDFPASYVSLSESNSSCDSLVEKCQVLQKKNWKKKRIVDRLQYDKNLTCINNKSAKNCAAFSLLFWFLLSSLSRIAVIVPESVVAETLPFEDALGPALVSNKWDPNIHGW